MTPESNPALQAAWKAHSSSFPIPPFDSEEALFKAGYEARDAEVERLRRALEASIDLIAWIDSAIVSNYTERKPMPTKGRAALTAAKAAIKEAGGVVKVSRAEALAAEIAEARAALQPETNA